MLDFLICKVLLIYFVLQFCKDTLEVSEINLSFSFLIFIECLEHLVAHRIEQVRQVINRLLLLHKILMNLGSFPIVFRSST